MTGETRTSPNGVVTYRSTSAAYASEVVLHEAGLQAKVIGVPRSLSTDCCLGIRIQWPEQERVRELLHGAGIEFVQVFRWQGR